jgi:hypothetical protein
MKGLVTVDARRRDEYEVIREVDVEVERRPHRGRPFGEGFGRRGYGDRGYGGRGYGLG